MSETSETKPRLRLDTRDDEENNLCFGNRVLVEGANYTYLKVLDEVNAALNQPVPCGVLLSEEEIDTLEEAARVVSNESGNYMNGPFEKANLRELCNNVYKITARARSAQQGETVTDYRALAVKLLEHAKKMREWTCDRHAFGSMVSEFDGPDDVDASLQVSFDVVAANVAIAAAEAALAAEGGA